MIVEIDSMEDERLDPYRNVKDRDLERSRAAFMAEGQYVLDALVKCGRFTLESILVSRKKLHVVQRIVTESPPAWLADTPIYVAEHQRMLQVVGFNIHRGILAVGRRRPVSDAEHLISSLSAGPKTVLVLEALTNHDNIGACFRNAAALGADAILLDDRCADPLYRKSIKVSAGHALNVPYGRDRMEAILAALELSHFVKIALVPSKSAEALASCFRPAERVALFLGTEGPGLSEYVTACADRLMRIPMAQSVDSLNVATAGAIALFALARRSRLGRVRSEDHDLNPPCRSRDSS